MAYVVTIRPRAQEALLDMLGTIETIARALDSIGLALPPERNTYLPQGPNAVFWIGPERAILRAPIEDEVRLQERLQACFADGAAVVPLSDAMTGFDIEGADALELLGQVCPLDLAPLRFPPGAATFTEIFATTGLLIHNHGDPMFSIYAERSLSHYVAISLQRAIGL